VASLCDRSLLSEGGREAGDHFVHFFSSLSKGSCLGRFAPGRLSQTLAFPAIHGYSHNVGSVRAAT
jgi:hypothetical protein